MSDEPELEDGQGPAPSASAPPPAKGRPVEGAPPKVESGSARPSLEGGPVPEADLPAAPTPDAEEPSEAKRRADPQAMGCLMACSTLLVGLLLGVLGSAVFFGDDEEPPETVDVLRDSPNVVVAIRDLARLETTSFHVERVIDLVARQRQLFGLVEAEDAILLVAAGDVVAGVDLTRMSDGDVVLEPERNAATITLPEPEIFSARLDNERTYVHTRDTDLTATRDPHLETRARREAERTLREAALEAGLLERARANAETAIGTLVRSLGYDDVTVRFAPPTDSEQ